MSELGGQEDRVRLRNQLAGRVVVLAAPFVWRRYRKKVYIGAAVAVLPLLVLQASRRIRSHRDEPDAIRDRIVDRLPGEQRSGPAPVPEALVESGRRDTVRAQA
jgi:hypothetical protein